MLQGSSMASQSKNHKIFRKFSFISDFVQLFSLIISVKEHFSLRNGDVMIKILNTVK